MTTSAFQYGWGENNNPQDSFWVRFSPASREPQSWKEETYAAARKVASETDKPIWLCSSGGIDSEIMCRAFYDQGIVFSVLTLEHEQSTNEHDIKYVKKWCKEYGVNHKIVKLDILNFLNKEIETYKEQKYITGNVFRYLQIRLLETVESLGGYAVLGGGEQMYKVDTSKEKLIGDDTYLEFEVGYAAPLEWCKRNNASHQPYFYFSTPELCLSYLQIPIVNFAVNNPEIFRHPRNKHLLKRLVYQSTWNDLKPRNKYSGFERVYDVREDRQHDLAVFFGELIRTYKLPAKSLEKELDGTS